MADYSVLVGIADKVADDWVVGMEAALCASLDSVSVGIERVPWLLDRREEVAKLIPMAHWEREVGMHSGTWVVGMSEEMVVVVGHLGRNVVFGREDRARKRMVEEKERLRIVAFSFLRDETADWARHRGMRFEVGEGMVGEGEEPVVDGDIVDVVGAAGVGEQQLLPRYDVVLVCSCCACGRHSRRQRVQRGPWCLGMEY